MLTKVPKFTVPSSELTSENIMLIDGGNDTDCSLIVYEQVRDFLSAPRCFSIIECQLHAPGAIELDADNQYDGIEYDEMGRMIELGVFIMNDGGELMVEQEGSTEDGKHVLISLANQRVEMLVRSIQPAGSYVARSAREALVIFLDSHDANSGA